MAKRIDPAGSSQEILFPVSTYGTRKFALDPLGDMVYWADNGNIIRANIDGGGESIIVSSVEDTHLWDITIDLLARRIHWTLADHTQDIGKLQSANLDGTDVQVVYTYPTTQLTGIEVAPLREEIYWVDMASDRIMRVNMNGSNPSTVINHEFVWTIKLDPRLDQLYFHDFEALYRCNLDGTGLTQIRAAELRDLTLANKGKARRKVRGAPVCGREEGWAPHQVVSS